MYIYYEITKQHQAYKGNRYFKVGEDEKVVQVCEYSGDTKKGKNNAIGILLIDRLTFFANYLSPTYAVRCQKRKYNKAFERVIKYLK